MERCAEVGARLLVDECFHDFLFEPEHSVLTDQVADNPHLILLRSFTKMYAMPGIRLGYCLSADRQLVDRLYEAGAPWSVSGIAQACGIAAAQDTDFPRKTRAYVALQRAALRRGLEDLGLHVIDGQVNSSAVSQFVHTGFAAAAARPAAFSFARARTIMGWMTHGSASRCAMRRRILCCCTRCGS